MKKNGNKINIGEITKCRCDQQTNYTKTATVKDSGYNNIHCNYLNKPIVKQSNDNNLLIGHQSYCQNQVESN